MEERTLNLRLCVMGAVTVILALIFCVRLYDMQIVNGDSYYKQSEKKITQPITSPPAIIGAATDSVYFSTPSTISMPRSPFFL